MLSNQKQTFKSKVVDWFFIMYFDTRTILRAQFLFFGWLFLLLLLLVDGIPFFAFSITDFLKIWDQPYTTLALLVFFLSLSLSGCLFTILMYCGHILECYPNCKTDFLFCCCCCCCCYFENSMQVFSCCGRFFCACCWRRRLFCPYLPVWLRLNQHDFDAICMLLCSRMLGDFTFFFHCPTFYNNRIFWMRFG